MAMPWVFASAGGTVLLSQLFRLQALGAGLPAVLPGRPLVSDSWLLPPAYCYRLGPTSTQCEEDAAAPTLRNPNLWSCLSFLVQSSNARCLPSEGQLP